MHEGKDIYEIFRQSKMALNLGKGCSSVSTFEITFFGRMCRETLKIKWEGNLYSE